MNMERVIERVKREWKAEMQKSGICLSESDVNVAVRLLEKAGLNAAQDFIRQRLGIEFGEWK